MKFPTQFFFVAIFLALIPCPLQTGCPRVIPRWRKLTNVRGGRGHRKHWISAQLRRNITEHRTIYPYPLDIPTLPLDLHVNM